MPKDFFEQGKHSDPIRYYYWPVLGGMYRQRVELCLAECRGGERVLEVGYGSGVTFLNLHEHYQEIHGIDLNSNAAGIMDLFRKQAIETCLQKADVMDIPYPEDSFDTVLLVSILEHLKPDQLVRALQEILRVLNPGGQVVYGTPVERPLMVFIFWLLGHDIREHHFSTEKDISQAAGEIFEQVNLVQMKSRLAFLGSVYEIGHFVKGLE